MSAPLRLSERGSGGMSRTEFEKALAELDLAAFSMGACFVKPDPDAPFTTEEIKALRNRKFAAVLRLYDEKPPAPEDLEAVARSAAEEGYDTPKQGFVSFAAIAEQVVTGYLASRPLTETTDTVCKCDDWAPGVKAINGPVVLQQIRAGKSFRADHFKTWRFCPWCGGTVRASSSTKGPA